MTIMNYTRIPSITSAGLLELFKEPKTFKTIDCRSYTAHNSGHIKQAINICCPSLLRRRLRKNSASLETLISCQTTLNSLRDSHVKTIVLYNDGAQNDVFDLGNTSPNTLSLLGSMLADELKKKIYYLKGGFQEFKAKHPTMCEWTQSSSKDLSQMASRGPALLHLDFNKRNDSESSEESGEKSAPVEILPFLFLGNESHCSSRDVLDKLGVTAVMNVSKTINNHFQGSFLYKNVPVDDSYNADISRWFSVAVDFIDSVETSGGKVLIHCQAGISRSVTICLAYLMSKRQYTLEQAYDYVKARRSVISPNFHFMGQLLNWEREIRALNTSISPDRLSPTPSQCGLFSYSNMTAATPDSRQNSLHKNSCFVTVSTPT